MTGAPWPGLLLLLLVTTLWGSTFAVVKQLSHLPVAVLIAWRFSLAVLTLGPLVLSAQRVELRQPSLWRNGLILGLWLLGGYGTQTLALQTISANRAAFITALSVILVPLWLTLVQRRRLPWTLWLALPLSLFGLALLSWEGGSLGLGDLWASACAVTYAGFIIALEGMATRHAALPFSLVQLLVVMGLAWLWALVSSPTQLLPTPGTWWPLLYLGVVATALTTVLQTIGQRSVSAAQASLIYALEPVTASLFSFFLIHEVIGVAGMWGGLLMVLALVLSSWRGSN